MKSAFAQRRPPSTAEPPFDAQATEVLTNLRTTLTAMLRKTGPGVGRAVEIERRLKLDKKLAWQVHRLISSSGLNEVENVPSASSMRRLLDAAAARRVPASVARQVSDAFDRFEEFARVHGGDRAGLVSMISGAAHGGIEQFELKVRKGLFRGNAHVYGVQSHAQIRTFIYHARPGNLPGNDMLMVQADIGLQQIREGQALAIACCLKTSGDPPTQGESTPTGTWKPVAQPVEPGLPGPSFLTEFCSKPLPELHPRSTKLGGVESELVFPTTGRTGAVTLYSSILMEDTKEGECGTFFGKTVATIPTELMVVEMLIPSGWTNPATARMGVYARRDLPEHVYELRKEDLLPQRERFGYLGCLEGSPPIEGAPDHQRAVGQALARLGWNGQRFDVYRGQVPYPVLHSMLFYAVDALA